MNQTFAEQILSQAAGRTVQAGDLVVVDVDLVMMHDSLSPSIIETLHSELGAERVWNPERVAVVIDHDGGGGRGRVDGGTAREDPVVEWGWHLGVHEGEPRDVVLHERAGIGTRAARLRTSSRRRATDFVARDDVVGGRERGDVADDPATVDCSLVIRDCVELEHVRTGGGDADVHAAVRARVLVAITVDEAICDRERGACARDGDPAGLIERDC